jgi:putative nucleotidyltransferase with HDIG domain
MTVVDRILSEVRQVPPLSDAGMKLMAIVGKDSVSAGAITDIVRQDAALAAQLLRVANSAAYRRRENIESINLAISLLGNRTVLGVVTGYCMSSFYNRELAGYAAPKGALWRNSVAAALSAQMLVEYTRPAVSPELAYTAGLLHGIGKAILSEYLKEDIEDMVRRLDESGKMDFLAAEEEIVGTNHCEIGAALARHWHLPESLCEAIEFHHKPAQAREEYRPLVYVVHLAASMAMMQGIDTGADSLSYGLDDNYTKYIRLSGPGELEKIILRVDKEYTKLTESFNP